MIKNVLKVGEEYTTFFVIAAIFVFRLLNSCTIKTYFDPDEYWQSIEISHLKVFGYGFKTWEWVIGLRSCLFTLPYIAAFYLIKICQFGRDIEDLFVIYSPRLIGAVLSTTIDYLTFIVAKKSYESRKISTYALLFSLMNWYNFTFSSRSLSNNLETILFLCTLLAWDSRSLKAFLITCGISIWNRPSAITHWMAPIGIYLIESKWTNRLHFIAQSLLFALFTISIATIIDSIFYSQIHYTWLTFLKQNIFEGKSIHYGGSPWHFHITQSIPMMVGTFLPFLFTCAMSAKFTLGSHNKFFIFLGSIFFNSVSGHKETRFIAPLLPLICIWGANGYSLLANKIKSRIVKRLLVLLVLVSNTMAAYYFTRVHQSAIIPAIDHLRKQIDAEKVEGIFIATPCHATPALGYLHRRVRFDWISCENEGVDESNLFYADPVDYLNNVGLEKYSHVLIFEQLLGEYEGVEKVLEESMFTPCWSQFNSHFAPDRRRGGDVKIFCKVDP